MSYIANQDIINRVGSKAALQLTTDSGTVIGTTVLDEARQSAEARSTATSRGATGCR